MKNSQISWKSLALARSHPKSTPFGFSSPRLAEANFPFRKVPTMLAAHFWIALSASAMPFRSLKTSPSGSTTSHILSQIRNAGAALASSSFSLLVAHVHVELKRILLLMCSPAITVMGMVSDSVLGSYVLPLKPKPSREGAPDGLD